MRLLKINNINVDIDEETAIGVNYQSYNVKEPGKTFITITNTFTIPLTSNNSSIFGNASNVQSLSTIIYEDSSCNYWVDNNKLIDDAKCRVEEINDRISIFIYQKDSIWDTLKKVKWESFVVDFVDWLYTAKGIPSITSPYTGTSSNFISSYADSVEDIVLPMYFGNLYNYDPEDDGSYLEDDTTIFLQYVVEPVIQSKSKGGHWCVYLKSIFEYIEDTYNVNFLTSGDILPGNVWDDSIILNTYIPVRDIEIIYSGTTGASSIYFIANPSNIFSDFAPLENQKDKQSKTLYDFVNSFFQHFNIIIDEVEVEGNKVIRLARFDDLELTADVIDWSGGLEGLNTFKPNIEGYAQLNNIKFKEIYPEGSSILNQKTITNSNINIDAEVDLFSIDAYVNAVIDIGDESVPDLSIKESFKTFSFFIHSGLTTNNINVKIYDAIIDPLNYITLANLRLNVASLYSLDSEYNFLDDIITYPKYYEVNKWLTQKDLKGFEFFKQYYIRELNGSFFVNKIKGFNPDKANEATALELLRLGDRTPVTPPDLDYWMDGVLDPFSDGEGDIYY